MDASRSTWSSQDFSSHASYRADAHFVTMYSSRQVLTFQSKVLPFWVEQFGSYPPEYAVAHPRIWISLLIFMSEYATYFVRLEAVLVLSF